MDRPHPPTTLSMETHQKMERSIEQIPVSDGLFAVRWTDRHTRTVLRAGQEDNSTDTKVYERVLTQAQIDALLTGDTPERDPYYVLFPTAALDLVGRFLYRDMETLRRTGTLQGDPADARRYAHRAQDSAHHALLVSHVHKANDAPFSCLEASGEDGG